jgi:hypothetical protein
MAKRKRTKIDLQNITSKSKDRVTRTPLKTGGEYSALEVKYSPHSILTLIHNSPLERESQKYKMY